MKLKTMSAVHIAANPYSASRAQRRTADDADEANDLIHHASITADAGQSGNRYARRLYAATVKKATVTSQKIANSRTLIRARLLSEGRSSGWSMERWRLDAIAVDTAIGTRMLSGAELRSSGLK